MNTGENSPSVRKKPKGILLGQLVSFGDCLYATAIARQIKSDFPGCRLTWAVGSMCRSILNGNPYIDEIWEIRMDKIEEIESAWEEFERAVHAHGLKDRFDEIYLTQLHPGNLQNYDGTIRSSIFRGYPGRITVPVSPVVRLSGGEIENVRKFVFTHRLAEKADVILFECSPKSGQSSLTPEIAMEAARQLIAENPNLCVILSSNQPLSSDGRSANIIDGSVLSFRENAELTKSCSLLVGCSSGISWLATSDWAKPLPMIQLLNPHAFYLASMVQDFTRWGLPTDSLLEMTDCSPEKIARCVAVVLKDGLAAAKRLYHEKIPASYRTHGSLLYSFLNERKYGKAVRFVSINIPFHHYHPRLMYYLTINLVKFLITRVIAVTRPVRKIGIALTRK